MKIAIITQARTTSSRLPGKVLLKAKNKTFIEIHLDRLKTLNLPIFIATTSNSCDDIIVQIAKQNNVGYYRGDEFDVLSRFYLCAKENLIDIIIRVTSDCPLIDTNEIQKGLNSYLENINYDNPNIYLSNTIKRTYPKGFDFEIFSFNMLEHAHFNAKNYEEREHVTPYFYIEKNKNILLMNQENNINSSDLRLTLDYLEDYEFLKILIEKYEMNNKSKIEIEKQIYGDLKLTELNLKCKQIALVK